MCGRYTLFLQDPDNFYDRFEISNRFDEFRNRFNIAPSQRNPVVTRNSPNTVQLMKWGLIPFWAKDPKIALSTINAKAETILEKPTFRRPFKSQRCLVPASGFYEWMRDGKAKTPYYFQLKSKELFSFAGLYDVWKDKAGTEIESYTIITTHANDIMAPIHDRFPVILRKEFEDAWLDKETPEAELMSFLQPYESNEMEKYEVGEEVNSWKGEGEELIRKI